MGKWHRTGPLSGMDAQRAMLDEMMGMNRNLDNPDAEIQDYRDEVRPLSIFFFILAAYPSCFQALKAFGSRGDCLLSFFSVPCVVAFFFFFFVCSLFPSFSDVPSLSCPYLSACASISSSDAARTMSSARPRSIWGSVKACTMRHSKNASRPT